MADLDTHLTRATRLIDEANRAAQAVPAADRVRIGILTPLTEPGFPVAGEMIARGAALGAQYVAEHGGLPGGKQFEFLLENDQATANQESMWRSAVAGMAKLAIVEKVVAVLGQWHLRTTPWVVELAERIGVPIFVENGHDAITAQRYRTVFRSYFSIADRVPMMVRFVAAQGARRVAIIAPDTVFGKMMADAFESALRAPELGMDVLRVDYVQLETQHFDAELRQIAGWEPDFIVNLGVMAKPTALDIIKEATDAGLRPRIPMIVSFPFPNAAADFWRAVGAGGEGIVWPALEFRTSWAGLTDVGRWLIERYARDYGSFPPDPVLGAFTDTTIIAQALAHAPSASREDLIAALESTTFDTWRGPLRYERGAEHWHHSPPRIQLLQYQQVGQAFEDAAIVGPPELATHAYQPPRSAAPR